MHEDKNILLTSHPGVGKTTLIIKLIERLKDYRLQGFYTEEICEAGKRLGFQLRTLEGERIVLAHENFRSPYHVGKYGVDIEGLERVLGKAIRLYAECDFYIIDEIAKMECLSAEFRNIIEKILDSKKKVIATIAKHGNDFAESVKKRNDVYLLELTRSSRDYLLDEIINLMEL
jgi:nucleoside-triphosphatase